jgi:hypothetical protein
MVVHSVHYMSSSMELSAMYVTVTTRNCKIPRLVLHIKEYGINMLRTILDKHSMVLEECYKDQGKVCLGIQLPLKLMYRLMMSLLQNHSEPTTLLHHNFTALKQYVLHVVL